MRISSPKYYLTALAISLLYSCANDKNEEPNERQHQSDQHEESDCGLDDGTYSADVEYSNPTTGYNNTYTLNVEVENCEVVQIDFPNGGYLDNDHIDPTALDEDGNASVEDDRGRTFDVHIDIPKKEEEDDGNQ